jgi:SAM-dependent methyltransferase
MTSTTGIQELQELAYGEGYEYRAGSPHLKHPQLYDWFSNLLREEVRRVGALGLSPSALEIGAGDGAFVEPLLATGASVTATEMSRSSIEALETRFGSNRSFEVYFDGDGSLASLGERRFPIVFYASVLHHIPDYLGALANACDRHLCPGGTLLTLQDPLWYPSLPPGVHAASEAMYLSWRIVRGDLVRGLASRFRRARNDLRLNKPGDMVEYHVVRNGVDQRSIERLLEPRFELVTVASYWSTQAAFWQSVGERLGLRNTFAVQARNYLGEGLRRDSAGASGV